MQLRIYLSIYFMGASGISVAASGMREQALLKVAVFTQSQKK